MENETVALELHSVQLLNSREGMQTVEVGWYTTSVQWVVAELHSDMK